MTTPPNKPRRPPQRRSSARNPFAQGNDTTLKGTSRPALGDERPSPALYLRILGDGILLSHPLPSSGSVLFGRFARCDVVIDDPSISRHHARLHLGATLRIEDLGSTNGTRVSGRILPQGELAEFGIGDVIEIGSVMAIVQPVSTGARLRRLWSHGYFEGRLEDECARAERSEGTFAIVRFHVEGPSDASDVHDVLSRILRPMDVMAAYAPFEYEVLLVDSGPQEALEALEAITEKMVALGARLRTGTACYPRDGRAPDALIAKACASVRPVPFGEEDRAVVLSANGALGRLHKLIERIASGTISVILLGETGVGKEVLAERVHRVSPRATKPFLRLNCAALSAALLESELFGHEKGAFTGAVQTKLGLLEIADQGTVFLDEIGELPINLQVKLLRVLDERRVMRVGSVKSKAIDVRFISATNRDLEVEVAQGRFREDLYYRLNGISLLIPPLRERTAEIAELARNFAREMANQMGRSDVPAISDEALSLLERYSWPGNIRELKNVVERAVLLGTDNVIAPEHLPVEKMSAMMLSARRGSPPAGAQTGGGPDPGQGGPALKLKEDIEAVERTRIIEALRDCTGNQTRAAKMLGISRNTLASRMEAYGLPRPRKENR